MNNPAGMSFDDYLSEQLENPEFKAEYEALAPQYEVIKAVITARLEQGVTQTELARRIGTRQSNISRLESGDYNPSVEFLQKIASALNKRLQISLR